MFGWRSMLTRHSGAVRGVESAISSLQCSHFMGPQLQEQVPVGHLIPAQDLKSNIRTNNSDDVDAEAINRTG